MKSLLIPSKTWQNYIKKLAKIDLKAAADVVAYMTSHDASTEAGAKALVDYAYAVSTKYGEAAAELTCQMYDAIAYVSKAAVPAAEPAATATYGEIAKTVYGTLASTKDPGAVGAAVGRSVKLASVDTLQQNALRDGAEWAWIPSGDSCAFCMMLASRGWVKASAKAIKNGHAEHVHNNCDCTYCVRFDNSTTVEGYDPDALYDEYINAGDTPSERLNGLRRKLYAENPEKYRVQHRLAYARKTGALYGAYNDQNDPFFKKREKIAKDLYAEISNRKRQYEIDAVAKNSGFSKKDIDTVFAHIFEEEHLFENGSVHKFDPDYYMAQSWLRLREGKNIQEHDIILLHHELEEARIMNKNLEIPYEKAHNEAEKNWNYKKALLEYLKTHEA